MIAINNKRYERKAFPDGTPNMLDLPEPTPDAKSIDILWCFDDMAELSELYMIASHYAERHPYLPRNLEMPYVPNARMDRTHGGNECFTLKYTCQMINAMGFARVEVFDPHSDVTAALLDRVVVTFPYDAIAAAVKLEDPTCLFFPDAGAQKRYASAVTGEMGVGIGIKERDWKTGRIKGVQVLGDYSSARVLIVDDICSYGGTFDAARAEMDTEVRHMSWGPNSVSLYVSHCEKSIFDGRLFGEEYQGGLAAKFKLYTTDSILKPEDVPEELAHRVFFVKRFRDVEE